jgi:hypothetical protein
MARTRMIRRELRDRIRSVMDRFRWPGGRPPHIGGAVPACVVGSAPLTGVDRVSGQGLSFELAELVGW